MLAYAAHRRQRRSLHPAALTLILVAHAIALGLLITAKMDVGSPLKLIRTEMRNIPLPVDPPPPPPPEQKPVVEQPQPPAASSIDVPPTTLKIPLDSRPAVVPLPTPRALDPVIGPTIVPLPLPPRAIPPLPPQPAVKVAARLATPADRLRPPYPDSKRRLEEEAVLRLRLQIDPRGRVVDVAPVGAADPEFLVAARTHLLRNWRYKPATEDGQPVATSLVITLRFELEE